MGLSLRIHLFHGVQSEQVYRAYQERYLQKGYSLLSWEQASQSKRRDADLYDIHQPEAGWVLSDLDYEYGFNTNLDVACFVSESLQCSGFYLYIYDGDYWGYWLLNDGNIMDKFVQEVEISEGRPPGTDAGDARKIAELFPWLAVADIEPYLVQENWDDVEDRNRLNVRARPGDEFTRFDECSLLDFLRLLGISVEMRADKFDHFHSRTITFLAPLWRQFAVLPTLDTIKP